MTASNRDCLLSFLVVCLNTSQLNGWKVCCQSGSDCKFILEKTTTTKMRHVARGSGMAPQAEGSVYVTHMFQCVRSPFTRAEISKCQKLNNLSRQHLSERPVMGGWRQMERRWVSWMSEWGMRGEKEWRIRKQEWTGCTHTNRNCRCMSTCVLVSDKCMRHIMCTCIDSWGGEGLVFGVGTASWVSPDMHGNQQQLKGVFIDQDLPLWHDGGLTGKRQQRKKIMTNLKCIHQSKFEPSVSKIVTQHYYCSSFNVQFSCATLHECR